MTVGTSRSSGEAPKLISNRHPNFLRIKLVIVGTMLAAACSPQIDQGTTALRDSNPGGGSAEKATKTKPGDLPPGGWRQLPTGCVQLDFDEADRNPSCATELPDLPYWPETGRAVWGEVVDWWEHGDLLTAEWLPREGSEEELFASLALDGGPSSESGSVVAVFYQYNSMSAARNSYWRGIDEGGWAIEVNYYAAGVPLPYQAANWRDAKVAVRGIEADLHEMRRSKGSGNNWRTLRWIEELGEGGSLQWQIGNHPDLYTVKETIEFANRLAGVG